MREDAFAIAHPHLPSELDAALLWLDGLGIPYSHSRFKRYQATLNRVESARVQGESQKFGEALAWAERENLYDLALRHKGFVPLFEANELVMIQQGLMQTGLETYLRPRLELLVSGPDSYLNEKAGRSKARDTAFELSVMY